MHRAMQTTEPDPLTRNGMLWLFAVPLAWLLLLVQPAAGEESGEQGSEANDDDGRTVLDSELTTEGDESLLEDHDAPDQSMQQRLAEQRAQREAERAEVEERERRARLREDRAAGWTFMHASTRSRLGLWLTHGNDSVARFFHDLHGFLQIGFTVRDWDVALFSMWGGRFQATSIETGADALWLGGKVKFPAIDPEVGLLGAGMAVGLPTNRQVDGSPVVFADHANTLIFVDVLTLDFGLYNSIYFSDTAGLNLHANLQFPIGMRNAASVNAGLEAYWRHGLPEEGEEEAWDGWSNELRGGVQVSTAFTPFVLYVEPGLFYRERIRFAFRAALTLGVGKNLGNVSDLQLLGIFEWRFG